MSDSDTPLSELQMKLMTYIDDEMSAKDRSDFDRQLAADPKLAAEVAGLRAVDDATRGLQLAEPTDHEIQRFWWSFYNRGEWRLGWVLLLGGLLVLVGYALYLLIQDPEIHNTIKVATVTTLTGGLIVFWNVLRMKIRTRRLDRYRGVIR